MAFQNSVVGGVSLVRPAIQSPNFATGSTGWQVSVDGSAEFNNVVIRGGTTVSGTSLYYDGTPAIGNLIGSLAATSGTDAYGNAYRAGFTVYATDASGRYSQMQTNGEIAIGYTSVFANAGEITAIGTGMRIVTPYTNAAPNNDPVNFSMLPGGTTGLDRGYVQFSTNNGFDIDFALYASLQVNTQETDTVPVLVDAVSGVTANLVQVRVNSVNKFVVNSGGTTTISPTASAGAQHLVFNEGYSVYADNTGAGASNSRLWIDAPDNGQVVIGPRAGAQALEDLRLRTDATTASAANMFIDSASYKISRSTSSLKYKQDVEDLSLDLDAVRQLRPVRFHDKGEMTSDPANARWYVGLIAEEVEALGLTEFVTYMNGEPDALMYDRFCVALLLLLQNVEARVSALELA